MYHHGKIQRNQASLKYGYIFIFYKHDTLVKLTTCTIQLTNQFNLLTNKGPPRGDNRTHNETNVKYAQ